MAEQSLSAAFSHQMLPSGQNSAESEGLKVSVPGRNTGSSPELYDEASSAKTEPASRSLAVQVGDEVPMRRGPAQSLSMLGAMLFKRGVSGTRVIAQGKTQSIAGHSFQGYGAHHDSYPHTYLTFAAALGTTKQDVDEFLRRLKLCLEEFKRTA